MAAPDVEQGSGAGAGDDAGSLLGVTLALVSIGIVMVWSTSAVEADRVSGDPTFFLRRQVLWVMLAAIALALAWATDYRSVIRLRFPLLVATALALVSVLFVPGRNGAHRWFEIGGLHAQPSEAAKLAVVVFLAAHSADRERLATFRGALEGFGALGLVAGLIAVEPDLGTAALVATTGALMMLVAGVRLGHAAILALPAAALAGLYAAVRFAHVQARLAVFLHPEADPQGKGFQIRQALIALGSGGPTGLGLGASRQKLFFLPEDHTDFILAIIGEELGLVGTAAVLILFAAFVHYGIRVALGARDREGFLLAFGATVLVGLQAAMNFAVVTASMPTKGISLPFVSFGGSSLLFAMAGVGLLLSVAAGAGREEEAGGDARTRTSMNDEAEAQGAAA